MHRPKRTGILLLGPTGAGKSPLGDRMEQAALNGRAFRHFDFGANLRHIVSEERPGGDFSAEELDFLHDVLRTGALLEDDRFPLAERILRRFLDRNCRESGTEVVLNGLPRHLGQAEAVGNLVRIHTVVSLACSADVVLARIGTNVGGDRADRADDNRSDVRRKLEVFAGRTEPLVDHYRQAGSSILVLPVTAEMTADSAWKTLQPQLAACSP